MTPFTQKNFAGHATLSGAIKRVHVWFFLALLFATPAMSSTLELTGQESTAPHPQIAWLLDETGTANLPDIQLRPDEAFKTADAGLALGFIQSVVWLRFDLLNNSATDTTWLLHIADPLLDDIRVYQQQPSGQWLERQLGDQRPQSPEAVDAINPVLPVNLPPGKETRFYIRVKSRSSMLLDLRLMTARQFYRHSMTSFLGYGAMFGIVAAMCLYNLFLFFSLRDPNYLLYVVSISTTALFLASLSGHAPHWLWPEYRAWSEEIFQFIVAIVLVAGLWFCTRFLEAPKYAPRLHKVILVLIGLSVVTAPLAWLTNFQLAVHLTGAVSASAGMVGMLTAITCLLSGQRSARFYLIAWAGYCTGTVFTAARQHGFVDNNFLTTHGMEMGAVLETVLISFALSDRYNQLKLAKEKAQAEVAESLRRMDRLKDEFLANTSHELRTPLQGIIGLAESMLDGAAGKLSDAARQNLSMIVGSGQRLASLVGDILDFSKMKNHELQLRSRPVDLHVAVDVALRMLAPLAQAKSLALHNEVPAGTGVLADEDRLQQILHNLIGNGIKFTESGSVRVAVSEEGPRWRVQIIDTGPGIEAGDHERIFESFEQVEDSETRAHGGTGLGLAVTRQLVELHDSEISLSSEPGKGACFSFALTKADVSVAEQAPESAPVFSSEADVEPDVEPVEPVIRVGDSGQRVRILVVDDEPVNQQVMKNHLTIENYEVVQAENGPRALEILQAGQPFDLVLLDVMMPAMSGFEVCREIRKTLLPTQLPVVMVTARTQTQDLKLGLQAGANDYLTKPVSKEELLARIKTHLNLLQINEAYSHYVPHEFLRYLKRDSITEVRLGDNVEMDAAVLVSDIRNFSTISETMTPNENFDFINRYFSVAGPPIRNNGGFIDNYLGDGILAVFPGGAGDALGAARETLRDLKAFNEQQLDDDPIRIGIGLHYGSMRLGIVGEAERRQGDIFADTVNVASRIEGLTKTYGTQMIVSEAFVGALPDTAMLDMRRSLGSVPVKGRQQAVALHEVFEFDAQRLIAHKQQTRAAFEEAQQHYHAQRYSETLALLGPIMAANQDDVAARHLHGLAAAELHHSNNNSQ